MERKDFLQRIAGIHNLAVQIAVSGDNAILMGNVLVGLRQLIQELGAAGEQGGGEQG